MTMPTNGRGMIAHVHSAGERTGRRMKIFMDLGGPKVRTGAFAALRHDKHAERDELIALTAPGELRRVTKKDADFAVECSLPEAIDASRPGDRLSIDDGKLEARVERVEDGLFRRPDRPLRGRGLQVQIGKGPELPGRGTRHPGPDRP